MPRDCSNTSLQSFFTLCVSKHLSGLVRGAKQARQVAFVAAALFVWLTLAPAAQGQALTQTKTAVSASAGTSIAATYAPAAVAGHLLVAVVAHRFGQVSPATTLSIASTGGAWTTAFAQNTSSPGMAIFYKTAAGGETTVTVTGANLQTGSERFVLRIYEFSGVSTTLDKSVSAVDNTFPFTTPVSPGTIIPTKAPALVIAAFAAGDQDNTTTGAWSAFTNSFPASSGDIRSNGSNGSITMDAGFRVTGALGSVTTSSTYNEFAADDTVAPSGWRAMMISFNSSAPTAADATVSGRITDQNGNPVAGAVVNLNGTQNRKFITDANGNYAFENVESSGFYTVRPSRASFGFSPAERTLSQLGNNTEAAFTAVPNGSGENPLDTAEYFVRQHYLDFLGREPEEAGFNFWSDQILECGSDSGCIERRRINVSAAYFLSIEFQQTGGLVDSLYRASYGRRPFFAEFMPDTRSIAQNVIVGRSGWEQQLAANKQAFVDAWVQRPAFQSAYGGLADDAYVDTLIGQTGVSYSQNERDWLVSGLSSGTLSRGDALLRIAEDERFVSAKRNEVFVMTEYFGYLRRDPDASGYQFWLNKLNQFNGNFEQAEMVKAFIVSGEYTDRFPF